MFSNRIKEARNRKGITQKMLANRLGIAQTTVSGWENGAKRPSIDTIIKIANLLDVSTDYLLERADYPFSIAENPRSPYIEASSFEESILKSYRLADEGTQRSICVLLGLVHPAARRDQIKRA